MSLVSSELLLVISTKTKNKHSSVAAQAAPCTSGPGAGNKIKKQLSNPTIMVSGLVLSLEKSSSMEHNSYFIDEETQADRNCTIPQSMLPTWKVLAAIQVIFLRISLKQEATMFCKGVWEWESRCKGRRCDYKADTAR